MWRRNWEHWVRSVGKRPVVEALAGAREEEEAGHTLHGPLEPLAHLLRNAVPELGRAEVDVVDRVEVGVLDVPGERRAPHAKVEVGTNDAGDLARGGSELGEEVLEVRDVPGFGRVVEEGS